MANLKLLKNKILVAGANGLLGQKLVETLKHDFELKGVGRREKPNVSGFDYHSCDITSRDEIRSLILEFKPDSIINAAAYTNVDGCEDDRETCWLINVKGVENLAQAARSVGASLIHVSTDYVFDGTQDEYTEESKPNPLSYYGKSKLAGENMAIASGVKLAIVRTMILYGAGTNLQPNFATWLVKSLSKGEPVRIVDDQHGHPTLVNDLAKAIRKMVELKKDGIYHVCGADYVSRYDFAIKLAQIFALDANLITPIKTAELNQKADRPLTSHFSLQKIKSELGIRPRGIEDGLKTLKQHLAS